MVNSSERHRTFDSNDKTPAQVINSTCVGASLVSLGSVQHYPRGATVFEQGSSADSVYLVEDGWIKLSRAECDGPDVVVGLRDAGALLGHTAALLREAHWGSAEAVTKARLRRIPVDDFRERLKRDLDFCAAMQLLQSREIHDHAIRVASIGGLSVRRRLEMFIAGALQGRSPDDLPMRLSPPLLRSELAAAVQSTPEHLSRVLKELEREGVIRRERGWLVALRPTDRC
jgi:CRP-like cAMP-binding protein